MSRAAVSKEVEGGESLSWQGGSYQSQLLQGHRASLGLEIRKPLAILLKDRGYCKVVWVRTWYQV